ncbi:WbqC family protein [Halpernia frigidisoli]|uniref:WbqC-like protein family protein n=1 Tax=Halpernia frigidisoli TaxID=1125876 RepID=A0A1I3E6G1_9FLAO|nr:WbqC family protein [Halpernia frigidisoli]SFH94545.1 WbqC-like protein family protein [Halpernia frigidisoli]
MENQLFPLFYLPPISWFSKFLEKDSKPVIEKFENFPKQTYRNRTNIYGANGKLTLVIPINHTGSRLYKDTKISYDENWQKQHWKSIKNAYQSSPYFEFYEDRCAKIYEKKEKFLFDFNLNALEILISISKTAQNLQFSDKYESEPSALDLRSAFSAKNNPDQKFSQYYQIFEEKYGFIENLSVCDLFFNLGPESLIYLKNHSLSN